MAKKKVSFAGAMSKVNPKVWGKARQATPGGKRELPVIEDGTYPCVVSAARTGVGSDGNPWVSYAIKVESGEYEGTALDKFQQIKDHEKDLERVVKNLRGMGYPEPEEDQTPDEYIDGCHEDINANKPRVLCKVINGEYESTKTPGEMVRKVDVYVNRPLSDEETGDEAGDDEAKPAKAKGKTKAAAPAKKAAPKKKVTRK